MKVSLFLLAVVPVAAAPLYTVVNLGGVGGSLSEAFAISASGAVAGTAIDVDGRSRGFAYESFTQIFESDTDLRGINAKGELVGTRDGVATIWRDGATESLGTLGGTASYGAGINDLGHATGGALRGDGQLHAFLSFGGHMLDAGTLGGTWSSGYSINNAGQIAGVSETSDGQFSAFRWDETTGMQQLVGRDGNTNTRAFSLNSVGQVAGLAMTSQGHFHAAMWDLDGVVTDLGSLGGGGSFAYGISDSGSVVGYSYDTLGRQRAFVWNDGMLFDLNTLIDTPDWSLTAAYGINSNGQIVGSGYYRGVSSSFLLDPAVRRQADSSSPVPEPAMTLPLLLIGAVATLYSRKR